MFVLVTYDVADDKLRTRIAQALEGFGRRVQYSVFECNLTRPQYTDLVKTMQVLAEQAEATTPPSSVSIRCYRLCRACTGRVEMIGGGGGLTEDPGYYIV